MSGNSKPKRVNAATILVQNYVNENREDQGNRQRWDDLESLYQTIASGMVDNIESHAKGIQKFRQLGLDTRRLDDLANMHAMDIEKLSDELVGLHSLHEGKTGFAKDGDEFAQIISVSEGYNMFAMRMRTIMLEFNINMTQAFAQFHAEVTEKLNKEDAAEKAKAENEYNPCDITVIDDAVIKEKSDKDVSTTEVEQAQ